MFCYWFLRCVNVVYKTSTNSPLPYRMAHCQKLSVFHSREQQTIVTLNSFSLHFSSFKNWVIFSSAHFSLSQSTVSPHLFSLSLHAGTESKCCGYRNDFGYTSQCASANLMRYPFRTHMFEIVFAEATFFNNSLLLFVCSLNLACDYLVACDSSNEIHVSATPSRTFFLFSLYQNDIIRLRSQIYIRS